VAQKQAGEVLQTWVSPPIAREVKRQAIVERRSVSAVVRNVLEDALRPARRDR
jgi:hypothetical protein